jgi:hypothetical protein
MGIFRSLRLVMVFATIAAGRRGRIELGVAYKWADYVNTVYRSKRHRGLPRAV